MTDDEINAAFTTVWSEYVTNDEGGVEDMDVPMTKEQMLMEIEKANGTIHEMENRLKNLERYKQYEDTADEIKAMHTAFMNSGFSDEQAYDLLKSLMSAAMPSVMKGLI